MSVRNPRSGPPDDIGTIEDGPVASILAALARDDPQGVVAALDGQLHHGRPGSPSALRQQVGERLAVSLASPGSRLTRWIDALSTSASPSGRQVATLLLANRYEEDKAGVLRAAEALADDDHWEVREAAGGLLGTLLDRDFEHIRRRCETLRTSRSANVRRAVVIAARYAARRDRPERVEELLDLLEPLLRDPEPYVRRNLGSFAIGDAFLRVDPNTTLQRLREWSRDRDQMVRWNVAMAFSSAIGSFHWPAAKAILERLARGPEPIVRMAVAKAMKRCRQRYTEDVEETRRRWLQDRNRAATAQLVGPPRKR
jgi:HEAT repeat protein